MKTQLFSQFISALISQENGTFRKMLFKPGGGNHLMRFESETSVFKFLRQMWTRPMSFMDNSDG